MYTIEPKLKLIGGIANIAATLNKKLGRQELVTILNLFGQKNFQGNEYMNSSSLIKKALDHYVGIEDTATAENILTTYTNWSVYDSPADNKLDLNQWREDMAALE